MASIQNNGVWPIYLPGLTLARGETATVANDDLVMIDMARALPALLATGDVTVARDAPEAPEAGETEEMPARFSAEPAPDMEAELGEPEPLPARFAEDVILAEVSALVEEMPDRFVDLGEIDQFEPEASPVAPDAGL